MEWGQPPLTVDPGEISNYGPRNANDGALVASKIVRAGYALLFGVTLCNTNASTRYFMFFDAATVPANTAVPLFFIDVASNSAKGVSFIPSRTFEAGIVIVNSTTATSLTIGSADSFIDAQYL